MNRESVSNELGDFLRARRAELKPADVGLTESGHYRRVPGLRREEVASIAAISTDYYTRLEQGRLPASAPVLATLARALRLDTDQCAYLFGLAGKDPAYRPGRSEQKLERSLQHLLDDLPNTPAFVIGRRTAILGWNSMGAALITDFGAIPREHRTFIRLLFTDPAMRELYADWEDVTRIAIAQLRMDSVRDPNDPHLAALVGELSVKYPEFREWWAEHQVARRSSGTKRLRHPVVGDLMLDWNALIYGGDHSQQIIAWTAPPGTPSHDGLRMLSTRTADARPRGAE